MQFPQNPHPHWAQNGRISTIRFHNLKYLEGNCMRNLSPGDERWPQGLRTPIHTFTVRACSGSSAKILAHRGPSRSSSAKNSPSTPPPTPHPVQNSPRTPPSAASPVQNSPSTPENTRCGHFSACRGNIFTHVGRTGRAGRMYSRMRIKQAKRKIFAYELSRL